MRTSSLNPVIEFALVLVSALLIFGLGWFPVFVDAATCATFSTDLSAESRIGYDDGSNTNGDEFSMPFTPSVDCDITSIGLTLKKINTPGDGHAEIYLDSASSTSDSPVATSATIAASALNGTYQDLTYASTEYCAPAGIKHWVVVVSDQTASLANNIQWGGNSSVPAYAYANMSNIWGDANTLTGWARNNQFSIYGDENNCNGGGAGGGSVIASTSSDSYSQSQNNLFFGIMLFMIGFFGMIWLIRKH